ncbi:MAG: preprotein translocase subunit SecG [Desulfobacterales bacterium]|nr:preprotein translocase subunit SecG [Desulfobacterales bacterium]
MSSFTIIIHIVVSTALILIVLLQTGKGADMGAAFGGGSSQTLFGTGGTSTFLSRLTTIAAIIFMITSLGLAYLSSHRSTRSVMSQMPPAATQQTDQAPSKAPVQPTAKEADAAKSTPLQPGENQPAQESGGES